MKWYKIYCELLYENIEKCEKYLVENISDQLTLFVIKAKELDKKCDGDLWGIEVYTNELLKDSNILIELGALKITQEEITPDSWQNFVQQDIYPIILDEIYIARETIAEYQDKTPILLDSSMAFGTGDHETTKGCLSAISQLKNMQLSSAIDIGCGSGILSIAAQKLLNIKNMVGTDIDHASVEISKRHAKLNECEIEYYGVEEFNANHSNPKFDLVLCNIFANDIINLYDYITAMEPKIIVFSGFLLQQADKVAQAYSKQYSIQNTVNFNNWITLSLQKLEQ